MAPTENFMPRRKIYYKCKYTIYLYSSFFFNLHKTLLWQVILFLKTVHNIDLSMNVVNQPGIIKWQILWYNSGHLNLLFLVVTVSHLIREADWAIFFQSNDTWQSWIVTDSLICKKIARAEEVWNAILLPPNTVKSRWPEFIIDLLFNYRFVSEILWNPSPCWRRLTFF